jgi:hypothetical protein
VARSIDQHNHNTAVSLDATRRDRSSTSKRSPKTAPTACTIDYCTPPEVGSAVSSSTQGNKEMIQLKIHDGPNPSAERALTMSISNCIHSLGLPFSVASQPTFRKLIHLAKAVGSGYKPPGRNKVAGPLLKLNYDAWMDKNKKKLFKEAKI